jgi:hypothetical protein
MVGGDVMDAKENQDRAKNTSKSLAKLFVIG